jgi:beta-xylosidase
MVFKDPRSGAVYLYAGGSAGSTLRVWELNPDMVTLKREVAVQQPPGFTEGPFMHERNGTYYLSYSQGNWDRPNYRAHYATAPSPIGPWTYRGVLLESDAQRSGPGHHSIVRRPGTDEWIIAYHRWEASGPGPFRGDREVAIQSLTYNADGTIQPVRMTTAPPPSAPLPARSAAQRGGLPGQGGDLGPALALDGARRDHPGPAHAGHVR